MCFQKNNNAMVVVELSTMGCPITLGDFYDYTSDEIIGLGTYIMNLIFFKANL